MRRRKYLSVLVSGIAVSVAGCSGDSGSGGTPEPECEEVADLGLPARESESFEVEAGQYVSVSVNNNYGARTHVVIRNGNGDVMFSEGVQDSGTWRVFESGSEEQVVTKDTAGEWIVVYTPADDSSQTSGNVNVDVCTPA